MLQENTESAEISTVTPEKYKFKKVKDSRGRTLDGLWVRNDRYYAQLQIPGKGCRRVPLYGEDDAPVKTVARAQEAYRRVLTGRTEGDLPQLRRAPAFNEYYKHYISWLEELEKKDPLTIDKERSALRQWAKTLGTLSLTQISGREINTHILRRKKEGIGNRTLNLDVIALNNCLKFAKNEEGWIKKLPTENFSALEVRTEKRELISDEDLAKFHAKCLEKGTDGLPLFEQGQALSHYVRFMCATGARRDSALDASWKNVDFERRKVLMSDTKYSKADIWVDFNAELEKLLEELKAIKHADDVWLFPHPQDRTGKAFLRETFENVRAAVKLTFTYHDCRHYFISHCVMAGIDYMTIAKWVGHSDGGVLIGRIYGHLSDAHTQTQAGRVTFGKGEEKSAALDLTKMSAVDLLTLLQKVQKS